MRFTTRNVPAEWAFASGRAYADPFHQVTLDVLFTDPDGVERRVPAFWAGEDTWRVRYASPVVGTHHYRSECSDASNPDLHGREGTLEVAPYQGENPLFRHGPLRVGDSRRHLEHADGTPFFWLGDTWWMGFCARLRWPGDFRTLVADRAAKGFSVIQIVAGLYPDMPAFDPRGANEAGQAWEAGYARLKPAYFDMADLRLDYLVGAGLLPCVVGCWGYHLPWLGVERMKQHWRNLVARWGAYPVVWCLAGEGAMPFYLSEQKEKDREILKEGWTELARYVRELDSFGRPITIHPTDSARNQVNDDSLLDFDMLQTGHGGHRSLANTVQKVAQAVAREPAMPVVEGEVSYEGLGMTSWQDVQRFLFWSCLLGGARGYTYGANGIWQANTREQPYGASPHGMAWGHTPWDEAMQLPGSAQIGLAKRLLERYEWWRFETRPEWIEPHMTAENTWAPYAAGIPGEVRVCYLPLNWYVPPPRVEALEPGVSYRAFLFDPVTGEEQDLGTAAAGPDGDWPLPLSRLPLYQDWVLVLDTPSSRRA